MQNYNALAESFYQHALQTPEAPALFVDGEYYTYQQIAEWVGYFAAYLLTQKVQRLVILAEHHLDAYLSVLAAHWAGVCYIPLNPEDASERLHYILQHAGADALVVDPHSIKKHKIHFDHIIKPSVLDQQNKLVIHPQLLKYKPQLQPVKRQADELIYIRYTSGTTGFPKGVMCSASNVAHFMKCMREYFTFDHHDKFSQWAALAFDISEFDMLLCWQAGACLYAVPNAQRLAPVQFLREHAITVFYGVPSLIKWMAQLKLLSTNNFPHLRYSIFAGEALTLPLVQQWRVAAANSVIENFYGPTEATISCSAFRINNEELYNIPIGLAFAETEFMIVDENLQPTLRGELLIGGPQVVPGYWQAAELTAEKFIEQEFIGKKSQRWYRTGDLVYQNTHYHFVGRCDNQYKINGQRIELEEIEQVIYRLAIAEETAVVMDENKLLCAFLVRPKTDNLAINKILKEHLPRPMIPTKLIIIDQLPYNNNGKLDRKKLLGLNIHDTKFN